MNQPLYQRRMLSVAMWMIILATFAGGGSCRSDDSDAQLRALQSKAIGALRARDAQLAYDTALKLANDAEMHSSLNQSIYLLTAAFVMDAVRMTDESRRVMGLRTRLLPELPKEIDSKLIAELLIEIQAFSKKFKAFHNNMQFELLTFYQQVLTGTISPKLPVAERVQQLEQLLGEHEQRLLDANVPAAVASILSVGNLLASVDLHDSNRAEKWLHRLQPLLDSPDVGSKWKALVWNKAADLSIKKRQFAEALENVRKFATVAAQSGEAEQVISVEQRICAEQLALVYLYMGDYSAARFLLSQTEAAERANPNIAQANLWRMNMSKALEGDREYLLAQQLLLEAKELSRDLVSLDAFGIRNNLAINLYLLGNLHEARQTLQECQRLLQGIDASDLQLAESHITAGWFNLADKELEAARDEFQKAQALLLGIPSAGRNHPRFAEALACEARVAAAMGDNKQAMKLIEESEALAFAGVVREMAATGAARDRLAILQAARVHPECVSWPGVFDTYLELAESIQIPLPKQFDVVLKWKGVLNDLEVAERARTEYVEIRKLNQQLRELYFRPVSRLKRRQHLQEIELIEDQIRLLERKLSNAVVARQSPSNRPDTVTLVKQMGASSAFLDILQVRKFRPPKAEGSVGAANEYLAFIALPSGEIQRVPLGEADEIDGAIDLWRNQILEQKPEARQTSDRVAHHLQRPLLKYLPKVDTLLIREDGMCHMVPWAALPGTEGKEYWVENLAIGAVQDISTSGSAAGTDVPAENPAVLVVGGVEYGPLSDTWQSLPGTLKEANLVAELFRKKKAANPGNVQFLSGNSANKTSVLRDLHSVSEAHLATHGFYMKQDSNNAFGLTTATTLLNSGLIFASAGAHESASQQLTAAEIRECNFDKLKLVVLSACETGMGKVRAGQGIDGLTSSFHAAGVRCVVSSRWKVPDTETKELMERFYSALWLEDKTPVEALQQAQLHMLRNQGLGEQSRQPVSWAAFTTSIATLTDQAYNH